jgi:hypothetical protein
MQVKRACALFAVLCLGTVVGAHGRQESDLNSGAWDGLVVVKTVDARRVVVVIDTSNEGRPADGLIDRVFLFTASEGLSLPGVAFSGWAHLEYSGSALRVVPSGGTLALEFAVTKEAPQITPKRTGTVRFDRAIGLSQYTGWVGFRLTDLDDIHRGSCDSCYIAGGHALSFPS